MTQRLFIFVLFVQFCFCQTTLYLGTANATDSEGCGITQSFPCATLSFAINNGATTIVVLPGVYPNQPSCDITSPITIQGQDGAIFTDLDGTMEYFISVSGGVELNIYSLQFDSIYLSNTSSLFSFAAGSYLLSDVSVTNSNFGRLMTSSAAPEENNIIVFSSVQVQNVSAVGLCSSVGNSTFQQVSISNSSFSDYLFDFASSSGVGLSTFQNITISQVNTTHGVFSFLGESFTVNQLNISHLNGRAAMCTANSIAVSNVTGQSNTNATFILLPSSQLSLSNWNIKDQTTANYPCTAMIDVFPSAANISLSSISVTNAASTMIAQFTTTDNEMANISVENIQATNVVCTGSLLQGLLNFQLDGAASSVTANNVYFNGCQGTNAHMILYDTSYANTTTPPQQSSFSLTNAGASNSMCTDVCFELFATPYSEYYLENISFNSINAGNSVMFVATAASVFVNGFTALNISNSYYSAFAYYDITNLTFVGTVQFSNASVTYYNQPVVTMFSCVDNPNSTMYFNADIVSQASSLFSDDQNCTVVVQGIPFELQNYQKQKASHFPTNWVVFGVCGGVVLLVCIFSSIIAIIVVVKKPKYATID